jgi:hypothetical protein
MTEYSIEKNSLQLDNLQRIVDLSTGEILSGGALGGDPDRGLSNINKVVEDGIEIRDKVTGKVFIISKSQVRISRLRRRVFAWADSIKKEIEDVGHYRRVMITLTYERDEDWAANQIRDFMLSMRETLGDGLVAYGWVAELQKRGVVHYHVILIVKRGTRIPKPDKSGLWKWGFSRIETAQTPYYLCTYVGKEYQKIGHFPKGLRMFSVWISKELISDLVRWKFRLSVLPGWFREIIGNLENIVGEVWSRSPGGGFGIRGVHYESPFEFLGAAL